MKNYVLCVLLNKSYSKSLLIHRKRDIFAGFYNCLGGKIEPSETPKDAVIREIFEETSGVVSLTNPKFLVSLNFPLSQDVAINNGSTLHVFYDVVNEVEVTEDKNEGRLEWKPIEYVMDLYDLTLAGYGNLPYFHYIALKNEKELKKLKV